ncbi:MAG: alanine racemase [Candidatus Eisenbacteria bacterium]
MPLPVSTWVEIDLDRFQANLRAIRELVGAKREVLLLAKADAYGHGAVEMAEAAEREEVSQLGVATLHEGMQLRLAGVSMPIVALSPLLPTEAADAVAHAIDPTVADLAFARKLSAEAQRAGRAVRCHIEVDTGMGRTGVGESDALAFVREVGSLPGLRIASLYTHFPDADSPDPAFSHAQFARFQLIVDQLRAEELLPPRIHAANSAATVNLPDTYLDLVRVGLIAYGVHPPHDRLQPAVLPVMSLRSRLVQVRELPAGTPISYSRTHVTTRSSRIGVVAVGYGHGYSWLLSNRGEMLVHGKRARILGRVTMDLTMIDLTDHGDCQVGDEVVLFGEQGGAEVSIEEVAGWSETLTYEVVCTIGKRVTRLYTRGGRAVRMATLVGERPEWTAGADIYLRGRAAASAATRKG